MTACAAALIASAAVVTGCGSDNFAAPVQARPDTGASPTALPEATVLRVIAVTPVPTATPTATPSDPLFQQPQKPFPDALDASNGATRLPDEAVIGIWTEYLGDTRLRIEGFNIDVHLCADGTMKPASDANFVPQGMWTVRSSRGRWYEVMLARQGGNSRNSGIVLLSRSEGNTVAVSQRVIPAFVTDSDVCRTED